jgi:tagatose 1,6-diphosphate aldolase
MLDVNALGKRRGLQAVSTDKGLFTILPLDHLAPFRALLRPEAPESVTHAQVVETKLELLRALAPHVSAVLLDAVYSLAPAIASNALPGHVGLIAAAEDGDAAAAGQPGNLLPGWSVAQLKRLGAAAVKFYFFYCPRDAEAAGPRYPAALLRRFQAL